MLSSEILNGAADLLEKTGWTQNYLARDHEGKTVRPSDPSACAFCLLGALWRVTDLMVTNEGIWPRRYDPNSQTAKDALSRILGLPLNNNGLISNYNDAPERTKEQVIETLREAARQEMAEGR